jgi:integrase
MPQFETVKVGDNRRTRTITLDEEQLTLECIAKRREAEPLRAWWHFEKLVLFLMDTGCRLTEAILAGPSWVKRKRWTDAATGQTMEGVWLAIPEWTTYEGKRIKVTKNGKARDVPLTDRLLAVLPELTERAEGTRWFPWKKGSSGPLYLLQNLREDMAAQGYDFEDVVLHTYRHTCATRLAEGGLDLVGLRDWLGHSDIKITAQRYLHLMNGHIYRGAAILDNYGSIGSVGGNVVSLENNRPNSNSQPSGTNRAMAGTGGVH